MSQSKSKVVNFLTEFSVPLIGGVILGLLFANINYEAYLQLLNTPLIPGIKIGSHDMTFHFFMNDTLMVFFFGIATVEIKQAISPGGSLNPISKALNPLMATLGGVLGPIAVYFILCTILNVDKPVYRGWGIPTATDIALAWLVAKVVFGAKHPAVTFLLLLAVADDGIGLAIIAIFYPDPQHPVEIYWLALTLAGMVISYIMRQINIRNFWPYIIIGGALAWWGLLLAHLHPALALVFIIPFIPADSKANNVGKLFEDTGTDTSPMVKFELFFKKIVDFGLLGFGLANAGVKLSGVNEVTWIVFFSLFIGKSVGVFGFGYIASLLGLSLPKGMDKRSLLLTGIIAGLGLTVALFVAGVAFVDKDLQGAAKMGALFSAVIAIVAIVVGKLLKIKKVN